MKQHAFPVDSTFWHLLFAQGTREQSGRDGKGQVVDIDEAFCAALVRSYDQYMRLSAAAGALPQPRPVSEEHIIVQTATGESDDTERNRRSGDVLALHHLTQGTANTPAGVYALIRWNDPWLVEDRSRHYLSPSTVAVHTMRDGTRIPGPFLWEVGQVALPALDTIGDMTERLQWTAMPLPEWVITPESANQIPATIRSVRSPGSAIVMRGATLALAPPEAPVELTPEMLAKIEEMVDAKLAETEERAYTRAMASMEERMVKMRAMEAPTTPAAAAADAQAVAEDESDITMRAAKLARKMAEDEVVELITKRHLAPGDVPEFLRRRVNGESPDDLLKDYSALTVRSGVTGAPASDPAAPVARVTEIKESEVIARAEKNITGKVDARSLTTAIAAEVRKLQAEGVTILKGV